MSQNTTKTPALDLNSILARDFNSSGGLNWYQVRVVALCAVAALLSALSTSEYVFTTSRIASRCLIPECESSAEQAEFLPTWIEKAVPKKGNSLANCQRFGGVSMNSNHTQTDTTCPSTLFDQATIVGCEKHVYEHSHTVVYTLDLACDEWRRSMLGSARTAGALLSLPVAGAISDRWGRRIALILVCFNTAVIGLLRVLAITYASFIISVFIEALFGAGAIMACSYVLGIEMVPVKYRIMTGVILSCCFSLGQLTLGFLAWAFPDWRHLTLVIYVPQLLTLIFIWILPESLRWNLSTGRYKEVELSLKRMAKSAGCEISEKTLVELMDAAEREKVKAAEKNKTDDVGLIVMVFRYKPILIRVLVTPIWWMTMVLIYYGLSINAVNISGNMYLNFVIVSFVDIPGFWSAFLLLDRIGRKPLLITCYWICCTCQIAYIFLPKDLYAASLTVYLIGKYSIAMAASALYVYTSEIYPTQYRHSLFGYSSMVGRVGSIIAPLTPALGSTVWEPLPFVLFALMALLTGILILLTPETKGCQLPDTMQEAADLGKPKPLHILTELAYHTKNAAGDAVACSVGGHAPTPVTSGAGAGK